MITFFFVLGFVSVLIGMLVLTDAACELAAKLARKCKRVYVLDGRRVTATYKRNFYGTQYVEARFIDSVGFWQVSANYFAENAK